MGSIISKDSITVAFAAVGAVLGIINTLHNLNQRSVRLRVVPRSARSAGNAVITDSDRWMPDSVPAVEVINLSAFAVTITQVGFTLKGTPANMVASKPIVIDGKPWPRRLEPHESVTGYFKSEKLIPSDIRKAFAKTDCGVLRYGKSPALNEFRRRLKSDG